MLFSRSTTKAEVSPPAATLSDIQERRMRTKTPQIVLERPTGGLTDVNKKPQQPARVSAVRSPEASIAAAHHTSMMSMMSKMMDPAPAAKLAQLSDPDIVVRAVAIQALAENGDERARDPLVKAFENCAAATAAMSDPEQSDPNAMMAAVHWMSALDPLKMAAADMPDRRMIPALEKLVDQWEDKDLRDILAACEQLPDPRPRQSAGERVRAEAARPAVAPLVIDGALVDGAKLGAAVRKSSLLDLLEALTIAIEHDNQDAIERLVEECQRRPLQDLFAEALAFAEDALPMRRCAAARALGYESDGRD
jgi:HEAT repeat protein